VRAARRKQTRALSTATTEMCCCLFIGLTHVYSWLRSSSHTSMVPPLRCPAAGGFEVCCCSAVLLLVGSWWMGTLRVWQWVVRVQDTVLEGFSAQLRWS
jgi:hypothetical protein